MNEIKLLVEEKNIDLVLSLLTNLKDGLILDIQTNSQVKKLQKHTQYQPKVNTIIREENSGTSDTSGKYMSPSRYKNRAKK